ncbi:hypothetical protein [Enterobacter mori]|uniref:hypothetical protein n=1 Tax=Enterobacter mori TaxID=539813 RepID=UPI0020160D36|nr:hypothetical protein [Enterobacter mori]
MTGLLYVLYLQIFVIVLPHAHANSSPPNWPPEIPLTHSEKQLVLQAMQNLPPPMRQEVLDDAAQRNARGGIQNLLAYLLATLRKAQGGEFSARQSGDARVCATCGFRA